MRDIALVILATLTPLSELRGGIILGIALGLNPALVFFIAVVANALLFFPVFFALQLFYHRFLSRFPLFNRYLEKLKERGKPKVDRYGFLGLTLFVAVPLPVTGVYTATFLSWLLGMEWRKAFPPIALGAVIAGVIWLLGVLGGVRLFTAG